MITFRPAVDSDADAIQANARPADVRELWTGGRTTPGAAIRKGLETATLAWAAEEDGEVFAVFGVTPASLLTGHGIPWMLATPRMDHLAVAVVRVGRPLIEMMQAKYPHLRNWVAADNRKAVRMLRWLGFTLAASAPHGPDGALFRQFDRRASDV